MKAFKRRLAALFSFPAPFLKVFPPLWLGLCAVLIFLDLGSKKLITNTLNYHLSYRQAKWLVPLAPPVSEDSSQALEQSLGRALANHPHAEGKNQIDIWGEQGEYIKLRLVFNDRFIFGLGPSWPYLGFTLSFFATCFLILYRWHNAKLGHPLAWLLIFSGAFGNLIDKLFIKSLTTREWILSLSPQRGYVSGVVDFVECIWFGWDSLSDYFILNILAMELWPTFNFADSMIVVGIVSLMLSMRKQI